MKKECIEKCRSLSDLKEIIDNEIVTNNLNDINDYKEFFEYFFDRLNILRENRDGILEYLKKEPESTRQDRKGFWESLEVLGDRC